MRVVITGAGGQLGLDLQRCVPQGVEVLALDRAALDITESQAVDAAFRTFAPEVVINGAAYTAVDRAEAEPDVAFAVNAQGAGNVARAAARVGARVLHVSTDFVFNGQACEPYQPTDTPDPVNAYGRSKLAGEQAVLSATGHRALVIRTAWLYASHGASFATTMLRLFAERDVVRVVADQIGTPTWACGLARALWSAAARPDLHGILHWTDAGVASWYDFAVAIRETALEVGALDRAAAVLPIGTADYPTPARRPSYSVLDKTQTWTALGMQPRHWQLELRAMLHEWRDTTRAPHRSETTTASS